MSLLDVIVNIIKMILTIAGLIGIIGILIFIPVGIVFLILGSGEKDEEKKRRMKRRGKWLIILPIFLIASSLIGYVIVQTVSTLSRGV